MSGLGVELGCEFSRFASPLLTRRNQKRLVVGKVLTFEDILVVDVWMLVVEPADQSIFFPHPLGMEGEFARIKVHFHTRLLNFRVA